MSSLLGDLLFVLVFQDDIVISSNSYEEHFDHSEEVLTKHNKSKLIINKDKCNFFRTKLRLLASIISSTGIRVDPVKLDDASTWPESKNT